MGQPLGLEDVVRDQDDGHAVVAVEARYDLFDQPHVVGVKVGGGFIQQQGIGQQDHGARQGHALRLAAGEGARGLLGDPGQPHFGQRGLHTLLNLAVPAQMQPIGHIGRHRAFEQHRPLKDGGDAAAHLQRRLAAVVILLTEKGDSAARGHFQEVEAAQQRALAHAAGADQRKNLAPANLQRLHGQHLARAVDFGHVAQGKQRAVHSFASRPCKRTIT